MNVLINPGSGSIADKGAGWVNSYGHAETEAQEWHKQIAADGIHDVVLLLPGEPCDEPGRWRFQFKHAITGRVVELETPGIDNLDAFRKERIFCPRVYWNGSSTSTPDIEQWAAEGFEVVKTLRVVTA